MQIQSSIHILFHLATKIKWISETELITSMNFDYLQHIKYIDPSFEINYPTSVSGICKDYLIIFCCSFLDEFEKVFTISQFPIHTDRILKLKKITLPAYKQIKKWKDLKKIRNNIIAHNHRIQKKSIFDHTEKVKYNIPTTNEEYTLLADLIFLIAEKIYFVFPEMIEKLDLNMSLRDHLTLVSDKLDSIKVFIRIKQEIEQEIENNL